MDKPTQNSPDALRAEILADARREHAEIIRRAQREAEKLLAESAAEAGKARQERLEPARTEAARRRESILATVQVEAARLQAARVETLLESVHQEVRRRLLAREGFDYRETVIGLVTEAVEQMQGNAFVVRLSVADHTAFGDGLAEEITRRVARSPLHVTISKDAAEKGGDLLIEDAEGRLAWDNGLLSRLERFWPELRRQIALQASLAVKNKPMGGGA